MRRPRMIATGAMLAAALAVLAVTAPTRARADSCVADIYYNGDAPSKYVFPNWLRVYEGGFVLWMTLGSPDNDYLGSITVVNYGTAVPGTDIANVYFELYDPSKGANTGLILMTFAGNYVEDSGTYPAWTWTGPVMSPDIAYTTDLCNYQPACGQYSLILLYADIGPCPTVGNTINLGFPTNSLSDTLYIGSVWDYVPAWAPGPYCVVPWYVNDVNRGADVDTIAWAFKDGPEVVSPGDTVTYTITYGRSGSVLNSITITDTLPPYMHYLMGTASPPPDPGWDPDPGPPLRLRWTFNGPINPVGGPTARITFQASVDWGNGEAFEPGSGDVGAPEGFKLMNSAHVSFDSNCVQKAVVTDPAIMSVRRFMFWKIGDNDMLFSQSLGQPPDEMTYSIFLKNVATKKTWWDVVVWDTVPAQLDPYDIDCGFEDPCVGWTMTPSGCAAASPGVVLTGAKTTILTWRLDMPPGFTLNVRWKAKLRPSVAAGETAINRASIKGRGRTGVVEGTGDTGATRNFTHLAMIKLNTMYVSYVGMAADSNDKGACPGYMLVFFPLNKKCQFELREIQYQGAGFASVGGVSDSIGCWIGDCIGGFPGAAGCLLGSGAIPGNAPGLGAGCKAERVPAYYDPAAWINSCPTFPFNFIFKVTSNAPLLWQMLTRMDNCNQDRITYAPASTLSYAGYTLYTWHTNMPQYADQIYINLSQTTPTTVHVFKYNYGMLNWDYDRTYELGKESAATRLGTAADFAPFRIISSDAPLAVHIGESALNTVQGGTCCCCQGSDNHGAYAPMAETGYIVGSGTFYGIADPQGCVSRRGTVCVGAMNAPATYQIWVYTPLNVSGGDPWIPPLLRSNDGLWELKQTDTVGSGIFVNANTHMVYGGAPFNRGGSNLFKIKVTSGGPIQVYHGTNMWDWWAGGSVLHSAAGTPTGNEFWYHQAAGRGGTKATTEQDTLCVQMFTPETGVSMGGISGDGYTSSYTTNGVDQCISFMGTTDLMTGLKRIWRFNVLTPGSAAIALFQQARITEKGFTAPFLATGKYYNIITPPVVFSGESFWITIVVTSELGGIVTNYNGTTSFTSTDPAAKILGTAMDAFNYTWVPATDGGIHIFVNVSLVKIGRASLVAADTSDGSVTGLASILVVGVDIKLWKEPKLSVAASGDTVRFRICWSNYSSSSAFTLVLNDAVPMGTTFIPEASTAAFDCGNTDGIAVGIAYSTATSATMPAAFTTALPVAGTRWLRWTVPMAGVQTTGCACFRAQVN